MKVIIDFDVLTAPENSFGTVSGSINLEHIPCKGDSISFLYPKNKTLFPAIKGFTGTLKIRDRHFQIGDVDPYVILNLGEIIVDDTKSAIELMMYFEKGFEFDVNRH
jgi:hypothetical protein